MRFEPRLIRPEEPDDSLDLPADLAELAEQLSADADFLAQRYPAHGHPQPAAGVDRGRRLVRAVAVAVLLAGIGLWGGRLWRSVDRPAVDAAIAADDSQARGLPSDENVMPGGTVPGGAALMFRSLSSGEQEGVLDLLEEQSSDEARVSI